MDNKIKIFIPKGEYRKVTFNEWFKDKRGDFELWEADIPSIESYDIYTLTEVEIPEGAVDMSYIFHTTNRNINNLTEAHYIPLPKPKIKKWKWFTWINGIKIFSDDWYTEKEIYTAIDMYSWHKISGSEIEV